MGAVIYHHGPSLSFPLRLPGGSSIEFLQGGGGGFTDSASFQNGITQRFENIFTQTQYWQISGVQFGRNDAKRGQTFKQVGTGSSVIRAWRRQAFLNEAEYAHATANFPNLSAIRARWLSFVQGLRSTRILTDVRRTVLGSSSHYQRSLNGNTTSFGGGVAWLVNAYRCWPQSTACGPGGYSNDYELFRFPVGSHFDYGWLELSLNWDNGPYLTPVAYAYDTSGKPIPAGYTGIPEPRELPLALSALTLGALGLRDWRKSRTKSDA